MSVLRRFAKTLGLSAVEGESGITVIPLQGYSNWGHVEPFQWLCNELLPDAIAIFVVLDRDYRPDEACADVVKALEAAGIHGHVWERKELESYLLSRAVISRLSGASEAAISKWLNKITRAMEYDVFGRLLDEQIRQHVGATRHAVDVTTAFKPVFDAAWKSAEYRLTVCPPKQVIAKLNEQLQAHGHKAVSMTALARAHVATEIPQEVTELLTQIEAGAAADT